MNTVTNWEKNSSTPMHYLIPTIIKFLGYDPVSADAESLSVGQQIVRARQRLGLSQKGLARQLGVDPTTVARWERGERRPGPLHLNELRYLFEYSAPEGAAKKDNGGGRGADSDR